MKAQDTQGENNIGEISECQARCQKSSTCTWFQFKPSGSKISFSSYSKIWQWRGRNFL